MCAPSLSTASWWACDGVPDFYRLHFHRRDCGLCVWAFDLLHHNGRDLRELPLIERKARLEKVIIAANAGWLHASMMASSC
jgi:ATP-dependent DNA ligase